MKIELLPMMQIKDLELLIDIYISSSSLDLPTPSPGQTTYSPVQLNGTGWDCIKVWTGRDKIFF